MMPDSPMPHLSYLGFQMFTPALELRPYIRNYWLVQREANLDLPHEEFLHAEGGFGMIFNFGDDFSFDGEKIQKKYLLDGANSLSRRMQFHGNIQAIGVRFYPGGAYPFLEIPLHELTDEFLLLDDLALDMIAALHDRIVNAETVSEKIRLLEAWFIRRFRQSHRDVSDVIMPSIRLLHRYGAGKSPEAIAEELYISQRQLERLFKAQVGITVKHYGRLQRVGQARELLKLQVSESYTDIALNLGYYDQSHFIREFKKIVGMTPRQYAQRHFKRASKY